MVHLNLLTVGAGLVVLAAAASVLAPPWVDRSDEGGAALVANQTLSGRHDKGLGVAVLAGAARRPGAGEEIDLLRRENELMKARLRDLQADITALSARFDTLSGPIAGVPQDSDGAGMGDIEEAMVAMEERLSEAQAAQQQYLADLDEGFALEVQEPAWSGQALDAIEQALASSELGGAEVMDLDCRSTLCRLEVEQTDAQPLERLHRSLAMQLIDSPVQPALIRTEGIDGRPTTIVFLTREGHDLPAMSSVH